VSGTSERQDQQPTAPPVDEVYPEAVGPGRELQRKAAYAFRRDCRQDVSMHITFRDAVRAGDPAAIQQAQALLDESVEADAWSASQHAHQVLVIRAKRSSSPEPEAREDILPGLSDQEAWDAAAPVRRELEKLAELRRRREQAATSGQPAPGPSELAKLEEDLRAQEESCARLEPVSRPVGVTG